MNMCNKCMKLCGVLLIVLGAIFLLQDLKIWSFWGISWFTVAFLFAGLGHIGCATCKDCQMMRKK